MLSKEALEKIQFVNFHAHTAFSILDGVGTVKDHLSESIAKGHQGCCITDHGVMSGCLPLYNLAKDKDFLKKAGRDKPVPIAMGSELYITRDINERNPENKYNHITVLAKNQIGYKNLCFLTSVASKEDHFYSRPRIGLQELLDHKEGLIVTSGCFIGMIPQAIHRDTGEEDDLVEMFKKEFGEDFYLEIHITDISRKWDKTLKKHVNQGFNPQEKVNIRLIELSKKHDVKTIIAQDSHMPKKEHHFIQSIMIWNSPSGKEGWHFADAYYMMSVEEMYKKSQKVTPYIDDDLFLKSCENTMEILSKCKDCKLEFEPLLPTMQYESHPVNADPELHKELNLKLGELESYYKETDKDFSRLLEISHEDFALRTALKVIVNNKKVDIANDEARHRLTHEINTIQRNGILKLIDYFMLLEDVTKFVRDSGHARGFGRGCLTEDALVLTKESGYKKIKDVIVGEHVYTKNGDEKPVLRTFVYPVETSEKLVKIKTEKSFESITFTKNHKIYGIKSESKQQTNVIENNPNWIESKDLSKGDFLFVSYPKRQVIEQSSYDLANFIKKDSKSFIVNINDIVQINPLTKTEEDKFSRFINFDKDLSYFVGKWVANGWINFNYEDRKHSVGIAFNSKNQTDIKKTVSYFESLGLNPKIQVSKNKSLTQLNVYNKPFTELIKSLFPEYKKSSRTKNLGDFKKLPNCLLMELMKGIQSADWHAGKDNNRTEMIKTTSSKLALEIKEALLYLNIPSSIIVKKSHKQGQYICNESYKVKFIGLSSDLMIKNGYMFDNGYFVKVLDTEEVSGVDKVYDLMVADEPSFLTSNYIVHNSGAGSLLAYALDITDVDPLVWGLLFERFLTAERIGRMDFTVPEVSKDK